jgi:hypothetical protein
MRATDSLCRFVAFLWAPERFGEAFHLAAVDAGDVQVKVWDVHRRAGETGGQLVLPGFQVVLASGLRRLGTRLVGQKSGRRAQGLPRKTLSDIGKMATAGK